MNQAELDAIKARALAALPDDSPPNMEKVKAMAEFRRHAANDVLELVAEVERLRAERQNHTLIHNDALTGLVDENERLHKGNVFSCGCRFSASPIGWGWDFCDLHASVHLQKREIERLRAYTDPKLFAAASTVLEVAGKGSDEEVDLALVMLDEAVKWWDSLPWKPGGAGIELPKYEE